MAIILPSFGRASEQARRAASANNLRQLGFSLKRYAIDNDGRYPVEELCGSPQSVIRYPQYEGTFTAQWFDSQFSRSVCLNTSGLVCMCMFAVSVKVMSNHRLVGVWYPGSDFFHL